MKLWRRRSKSARKQIEQVLLAQEPEAFISLPELAERSCVNFEAVADLAKEREQGGLWVRKPSPQWGSPTTFRLTDQGRREIVSRRFRTRMKRGVLWAATSVGVPLALLWVARTCELS